MATIKLNDTVVVEEVKEETMKTKTDAKPVKDKVMNVTDAKPAKDVTKTVAKTVAKTGTVTDAKPAKDVTKTVAKTVAKTGTVTDAKPVKDKTMNVTDAKPIEQEQEKELSLNFDDVKTEAEAEVETNTEVESDVSKLLFKENDDNKIVTSTVAGISQLKRPITAVLSSDTTVYIDEKFNLVSEIPDVHNIRFIEDWDTIIKMVGDQTVLTWYKGKTVDFESTVTDSVYTATINLKPKLKTNDGKTEFKIEANLSIDNLKQKYVENYLTGVVDETGKIKKHKVSIVSVIKDALEKDGRYESTTASGKTRKVKYIPAVNDELQVSTITFTELNKRTKDTTEVFKMKRIKAKAGEVGVEGFVPVINDFNGMYVINDSFSLQKPSTKFYKFGRDDIPIAIKALVCKASNKLLKQYVLGNFDKFVHIDDDFSIHIDIPVLLIASTSSKFENYTEGAKTHVTLDIDSINMSTDNISKSVTDWARNANRSIKDWSSQIIKDKGTYFDKLNKVQTDDTASVSEDNTDTNDNFLD